MTAKQTKARIAERVCRRPWRPRGSGTSARKASNPFPLDASMRHLHATKSRETGLERDRMLSLFLQNQTVNSPAPPLGRRSDALPVRVNWLPKSSRTLPRIIVIPVGVDLET